MDLIPGNRYLFDTTVYIDLLRKRDVGKKLHYQVRFLRISAGYSIITETELWMGIVGLRTEAQHIEVLKPYKRYFVNVTIARDAGKFWREFRSGKEKVPSVADCLIAATAKFYGLRLVSRNSRDMSRFTKFDINVDEYQAEN